MKTYSLSLRESRFARLFMIGFALSVAPLGAQSTSGGTVPAQPSTSGATSPGTSASSVTSPPTANTSFYNTPSTGTSTGAGGMYNPNGSNPTTGTVKTGTLNPSVNAGGGNGSGQAGGTTSPASP